MKVSIYARVSMDEADPSARRYQELENQLGPLREWAQRMGWEVTHEYIDRASGADPNRPAFKELLRDAMMLKFQDILIWRWDRFSRENLYVAVGRVQKLRERGVGIKSLTESWLDTGKENPMGDMILSMMAWGAAEERRRISDRTKAGISRLRNIGKWKGGRPRKGTPPIAPSESVRQ
jgi:DNA invertase Pin-like site-specific DNA recombinase